MWPAQLEANIRKIVSDIGRDTINIANCIPVISKSYSTAWERGALDENYVPSLRSDRSRDLSFKNWVRSGLALMHMQYICFQNARLIGNVSTSVSISVFVMDDQQYNS